MVTARIAIQGRRIPPGLDRGRIHLCLPLADTIGGGGGGGGGGGRDGYVGAWTTWCNHRFPGLVVRPGKVDLTVTRQHLLDDGEGFLEATDPVIEGMTRCLEIGVMPPRAQAENESATTNLVNRDGHLGDHGWISESGAGDGACPDLQVPGGRGHGRKQGLSIPIPG